MATVSERLRLALALRHLKPIDLAEKTKIGKSSISTYLAGEYEPKQRNLHKMARALEVDPVWLLGEDVPMTTTASPLPSNAVPVSTLYRIPIIGTVRAGAGGLALEDLDGYEMADVHNPADYFFLRVVGDSMAPHINEGDLALIRKQDDVESGELAVVVIDGDEGTIKKIIKKPSTVILQAFNPEYPPRVFAGAELDGIHIAGKVVRTVRIW